MKTKTKIIITIILSIAAITLSTIVILKNVKAQAEEQIAKDQAEKEKRDAEISALMGKITELENKPAPAPQIITKTVTIDNTKYINAPVEKTVAEFIAEWSPRVASVVCRFDYTDGTVDRYGAGSGFLVKFNNGSIGIKTNKHVIFNEMKYRPTICSSFFLNGEEVYHLWGKSNFGASDTLDIATMTIPNPSPIIIQMANNPVATYCVDMSVIGDKILILGYPTIGSDQGITVTEGIVSGIETDYYVTSAKIDSGNSGGIAVSMKNNCIIGMPTASVKGSMESLGRILKNNF